MILSKDQFRRLMKHDEHYKPNACQRHYYYEDRERRLKLSNQYYWDHREERLVYRKKKKVNNE